MHATFRTFVVVGGGGWVVEFIVCFISILRQTFTVSPPNSPPPHATLKLRLSYALTPEPWGSLDYRHATLCLALLFVGLGAFGKISQVTNAL